MVTAYERGMPGAKTPMEALRFFRNYNQSKGIKTVKKVVGVRKQGGTYYVQFTENKKVKRRTPHYSGVFGKSPKVRIGLY